MKHFTISSDKRKKEDGVALPLFELNFEGKPVLNGTPAKDLFYFHVERTFKPKDGEKIIVKYSEENAFAGKEFSCLKDAFDYICTEAEKLLPSVYKLC